ncbi:MAG: hypothetical protein QOJ03_595 [Frankiaceae bacterium]|nr:hypothetical protein [Frankiaceae bacterium]
MLVAAAVLPHPPLLVPALASGAAAELDELRTACSDAVRRLHDETSDRLFVVGADLGPRGWSFAPWAPGAPEAALGLDVPEPMALPLLVGAWLTRGIRRSFVVVDAELDPAECAAVGADLAGSAERVALLVMGDGSARHSVQAPGYVDERAGRFDDSVAAAFAAADPSALLGIDPGLADDLLVAGRAPWQVLAGAAAGQSWQAEGSRTEAPYGVGYHVVTWLPAGPAVSKAKVAR